MLEPPSGEFWLGTDDKGRSVLTLLIWGTRVSLMVGLLATVISMVIGTLVGLLSGYFGGRAGAVLFRLTEWFLVIPFLPLAIVLATVLGASLLDHRASSSASRRGPRRRGSSAARSCRSRSASTSSVRARSARAVAPDQPAHPAEREPMMFANTTLAVPISILSETTLSFLGLGDPTRISWGSMLDDAYGIGAITTGSWWYFVPPGVGVVLVVLSFTLVGQALEDVLDPRLGDR